MLFNQVARDRCAGLVKFRRAMARFTEKDEFRVLTAHLANGVLNLALSRAKGILDRNRDVLVLGCIAMRFGDLYAPPSQYEYRS